MAYSVLSPWCVVLDIPDVESFIMFSALLCQSVSWVYLLKHESSKFLSSIILPLKFYYNLLQFVNLWGEGMRMLWNVSKDNVQELVLSVYMWALGSISGHQACW